MKQHYIAYVLHIQKISKIKNMIHFLLDCGSSFKSSDEFNKQPIIKYLNDEIDIGYCKFYVEVFYLYLINLFRNYNYLIQCCLYSHIDCFRYILSNEMLDIKYELLNFANNQIINNNIDKLNFYNEHKKFDYKKTFLYLFNKYNSNQINNNFEKRNTVILKYIEDYLSVWKPSNNYIKNWEIKEKIHDLLIIKNRLLIKNSYYLPNELWFKLFSFITID